MPLTLLLRLPAPGHDAAEWLIVDESGSPAAPRQRGPLAAAAAAARGVKVVALAPATQILLAEPELPPGSGAKLQRAVPFALEEQLTEDVEHLCFAVGQRTPRGATPVAVVSREVMQGWVDSLNAAGIAPDAMYADTALMPDNPAQTVLWLEGGLLAVRRPDTQPFAIELTPVTDALVVGGVIGDPQAADSEPLAPVSALLYVTREDWARVQDEVEALIPRFESLKIQLLPEGPLPWLARELVAAEAVNLLQGEFSRAPDYAVRWRQWRTPALLALGLLAAHVAAQAVQIRQANHQTAALDAEIAQVFASAMPSEPMSNPRRQMQSRLDRIRKSSAGPQYFLRMVQALSGAGAGLQQTSIEAISFRERTLDMRLTAANVAVISQLSQAVARQGLTADIQSSTPNASGVEAHLQIRAQAAGARQ